MTSSPTPLPIETSVDEVQRLRDAGADFLLLDCREPDEFALARIEGAELLPMSQLRQRLEELEPHRHRHVVVHCHHGGRSLHVAEALRSHGLERVQSMAGGIDQWSLEVDPSVPRY